jgi:hypothetical protein
LEVTELLVVVVVVMLVIPLLLLLLQLGKLTDDEDEFELLGTGPFEGTDEAGAVTAMLLLRLEAEVESRGACCEGTDDEEAADLTKATPLLIEGRRLRDFVFFQSCHHTPTTIYIYMYVCIYHVCTPISHYRPNIP